MTEPEGGDLARAFDPGKVADTATPDTAMTVYPVQFDKDYMDFRPEELDEEVVAPKGSYALEHATEQPFTSQNPTGLEDVSADDLKSTTAQQNAETGI